MPFEKRLARLEAARNMRFQGRQVGVIFDADEADIHAGLFAINARVKPARPETNSNTASRSTPASLARN
jgi:hypothetical protein